MKKGRTYNREEIEIISKSAIGKSINDIMAEEIVNVDEDGAITKGGLGQLVEQYLFGIQTNSESEPDFMPAGIELKVTPYKKIYNNQLSAKERLVLNIIDYMNEYKNDFKSSHFWFKNNTIQVLWYLWEPSKNPCDFKITHEKMLELEKNEDLQQIEEDWNTIIGKIKAGKAHEISEADTMYLGACTKGANSSSVREQPFSKEPAMQRAFCFKNSYMTQLVRKYIGDYSDVEKVLNGSTTTFNKYVNGVINKYKGKTQKELIDLFNIDSTAKNLNGMIVSRMFGVKGLLGETEEFKKANIIPRTIRVEENGTIEQSLAFPAFRFEDILEQNWENSDLKEDLETTKFMFFVFKKSGEDYTFKGIKLWNMPELDIETSVRVVWESTYKTIKSGNIVNSVENGIRKTNFVGSSQNRVCHVRPHATAVTDTFRLPVMDKLTGATEYTKQSFWINNNYLEEVLSDIINQ